VHPAVTVAAAARIAAMMSLLLRPGMATPSFRPPAVVGSLAVIPHPRRNATILIQNVRISPARGWSKQKFTNF
jgi:hypothetical protein